MVKCPGFYYNCNKEATEFEINGGSYVDHDGVFVLHDDSLLTVNPDETSYEYFVPAEDITEITVKFTRTDD